MEPLSKKGLGDPITGPWVTQLPLTGFHTHSLDPQNGCEAGREGWAWGMEKVRKRKDLVELDPEGMHLTTSHLSALLQASQLA